MIQSHKDSSVTAVDERHLPVSSGVDPELFELTTAKMDSGGSGSRVADAFARLMSTMEKTSTSTRSGAGRES